MDDEYLYIGAMLQQDDIKARLTQRDTIIYYDNDFEVFIDPDWDGHNYFEIETNARGVIFDLMLDRLIGPVETLWYNGIVRD